MGIKNRSIDKTCQAKYSFILKYRMAHGTASSTNNEFDASDIGRLYGMQGKKSKMVLVDVVTEQVAAGTGGTSWALNIKKNATGSALLSTARSHTLAGGAGTKGDMEQELTLGSGVTRGALTGTIADRTFAKGDRPTFDVTLTGAYTAGPTITVILVFEQTQEGTAPVR